ncbi:hypothetical protein CY34DRAFT_19641 [Suillus luteus UH-Slu-Lm8-n1]|uniref:Uncharacterized protein n=1 Tax=Suillus luteus UH-Slu-Lm8-n1 TaxID=930992 RepID=A0A0C9Z2N0_9AGAM|nr:hypothetical protein CY34DRAFT_19641 [Suillus luteus UH-Slu-Lm8-n1]
MDGVVLDELQEHEHDHFTIITRSPLSIPQTGNLIDADIELASPFVASAQHDEADSLPSVHIPAASTTLPFPSSPALAVAGYTVTFNG